MLLSLVVVAAAVWISWWVWSNRRPAGHPPGPTCPLPVVGDGLLLSKHINKDVKRLRKRYGDVFAVRFCARETVVFVCGFDNIKKALSSPGLSTRPQWEVMNHGGGTSLDGSLPGLAFSRGRTHDEQRKFTVAALGEFGFGKSSIEYLIQDEVKKLMECLAASNGEPTTIGEEFSISVVNTLWHIVTGESLPLTDPDVQRLSAMVAETSSDLASTMGFVILNYPWIREALGYLSPVNMEESRNRLMAFLQKSIDAHKARFSPAEDSEGYSEESADYVESFLRRCSAETGSGSSFDGRNGDVNLLGNMADMFAAGTGTTACVLSWAVLFMVIHRDVQKKAQAEIDSVVDGGGGDRLPGLDDKARMPYVEAVIHEVQRCASPVPVGLFRATEAEPVSVGGFVIPPGTTVMPYLEGLFFDPHAFTAPYRFNPERFLDASGSKFTPHPYVMTFSHGKRVCPGQGLARSQIYCFLAGLLATFDIEPVPGEEYSTEPVGGLVSPPQPYRVRLVKRTR